MLPDKVTILAETAERPSEIDVERAPRKPKNAPSSASPAATPPSMSSAPSAPYTVPKPASKLPAISKSAPNRGTLLESSLFWSTKPLPFSCH